MNALTKEELEELAALEKEEKDRLDAARIDEKRQHLEALRLSKKLAAKHGTPGSDYLVLETTVGNIAIRRPLDVEIDTFNDGEGDDREKNESLAKALVIHPNAEELAVLMAKHPTLGYAIGGASLRMLKVLRQEEEKK